MINIEQFRQISFRGRVAFGVSCFENALIALKYDSNDWKIVLNYLWKFTSIQYLDDWNDVVVELIPKNLLEFKTYEEEEFERLSKDEYQVVEDSINVLFRHIYNLGISHVYTIIEEYGEDSLLSSEVLINFMIENKFPLPNIEPYLKFSIVENRGWGNKFIGTELSKIL